MSNEIKDTEKEEAEKKAAAEAKVKADAKAEAAAVAKGEAKVAADAKAEAEAAAEALAKKVGKTTRRVWRQVRPRIMRNTIIKTLMEYGRTVGDVRVPGRLAEICPNNANQYVLGAGAIEYGKQLIVLLGFVERGDIIEVDVSTEGVPLVTKDEQDLAIHERKASALRKKLGVSEPTIVI
jgi:hypothetical protein